MNKFSACLTAGFASLVMVAASQPAAAAPVLVSQSAWGYDFGENMNNVFGAGNYDYYTSYGSASAASVFSAANHFVFLEGGDGETVDLIDYLTANSAAILSWVDAGGRLLLQAATNQGVDVALNGVTIQYTGDSHNNNCGTLTATGALAFTFYPTPTAQCGSSLGHSDVLGSGLTNFMIGDDTDNPIIAGAAYGAGYIMYSGLTASMFHFSGPSLEDNLIAFTAGDAVPPSPAPAPGALALIGLGLFGLGALRRRAK